MYCLRVVVCGAALCVECDLCTVCDALASNLCVRLCRDSCDRRVTQWDRFLWGVKDIAKRRTIG